MRLVLVQPNYHADGVEVAGCWSPTWVATIGRALEAAGFDDVTFVDAMTANMGDAELHDRLRQLRPDAVIATTVPPMSVQAERTLQIARDVDPAVHTILCGIRPTYMCQRVLGEAPWIDYIVRGEGEEIGVELMSAILDGTHVFNRRNIRGIAFREAGTVVVTPARPVIAALDSLTADWSLFERRSSNNGANTPRSDAIFCAVVAGRASRHR